VDWLGLRRGEPKVIRRLGPSSDYGQWVAQVRRRKAGEKNYTEFTEAQRTRRGEEEENAGGGDKAETEEGIEGTYARGREVEGCGLARVVIESGKDEGPVDAGPSSFLDGSRSVFDREMRWLRCPFPFVQDGGGAAPQKAIYLRAARRF